MLDEVSLNLVVKDTGPLLLRLDSLWLSDCLKRDLTLVNSQLEKLQSSLVLALKYDYASRSPLGVCFSLLELQNAAILFYRHGFEVFHLQVDLDCICRKLLPL